KPFSAIWHDDPYREAVGIHGHVAMHLERCRELAAQGYRPTALSVSVRDDGKPIAASAWHRRHPAPEEREHLARRQATAAVTLVKMDAPADAWPLYRHRPDPEVRSQLICRGGLFGLDPSRIVERLDEERDVSAKRALILALGEYSAKE